LGAWRNPDAKPGLFFRADAASDSMFDPAAWPLANRYYIWEFMRRLVSAFAQHASALAEINQYCLMSPTAKLNSMHVQNGDTVLNRHCEREISLHGSARSKLWRIHLL
jgi:hypothetical protein